MADTAAHLVDRVVPAVPVRQWVLTLPFAQRFAVAFDRALCREVRAVFMRAVLDDLQRRARRQGVDRGRSGGVVFVQRFGGALNLNVHFHALVLDGVFDDRGDDRRPTFVAARRFDRCDLDDVLVTIRAKVLGVLRRRALDDESTQEDLAERAPDLAAVQGASIQGRLALGPRRGQRVTRIGAQPGVPFECESRPDRASRDGFSLHAGVRIAGRDRDGLERLCRYVARPAIATERLSEQPDGSILYELRHPWSDGTTAVVFEPLTFLEKLAALIPPPRAHQVTYRGVLAPHAALRSRIVPAPPREPQPRDGESKRPRRRYPWAELLARVFSLDVLQCRLCGGRREILAFITEQRVIRAILAALDLPTEPPTAHAARGPPEMF